MVDNEEYQELKVIAAAKEDVYRGWVRINKNNRKGYSRKDLITIEVNRKQSKLIRRILGSDERNCIIMDFDTRYNDEDWNLQPNNKYKFKFTRVNRYNVWKWSSYYWKHPDVAIRISFKLGLLSIFISIIAILVAFRSETIAFCEHIMNVIQSLEFWCNRE